MSEPDLGWRVWHLNSSRLESWAVDYQWVPGENVARCLANSRLACASSPGRNCHCGFWAVSAPGLILNRVGGSCEPPWHVMGLISGWGTVARHGREGFRAERAALRCVFTDRPWRRSALTGTSSRLAGWWRRRVEVTVPALAEARTSPDHLAALAAVATHYGVPVVSLRTAIDHGLLSELGVPPEHVREASRLADSCQ